MRHRQHQNYATAEYPLEWDEPDINDYEPEAISECRDDYLDADRIGLETREEFEGIYLENRYEQHSIHSLLLSTSRDDADNLFVMLNIRWRERCTEAAKEAIKPGGSYWQSKWDESDAEKWIESLQEHPFESFNGA